jgi:hypothetical protein
MGDKLMTPYRLTITGFTEVLEKFRHAEKLVEKETIAAVNGSTSILTNTIKRNAPHRYGQLAASFHAEPAKRVGNSIVGSTGSNLDHAAYQEFGTGIYGPKRRPITPKRAPYLVFKTRDGKWIRTKSVKGVRPLRYAKRSLDQARGDIQARFDQAGRNIERGLTR